MAFIMFVLGFLCGLAFVVVLSVVSMSGVISRAEEKEQARRKKFEEYDIDL